MRKEKSKIKEQVLEWMKLQPKEWFNMSEIARSIGKSSPTISKSIDKLKEEGVVEVLNKKSMKLVKMKS
jgi:biotin operon repressor